MKTCQFTPVVLYLPGHEQYIDQRSLYREEPELWNIFRRLSGKDKFSRSKNTRCDFTPNTVSIPGKEGLRCMCYENLMRIIKEKAHIPPPQLYRHQNGRSGHAHLHGNIFPSWTRKAVEGYHENKKLQYPLPTLLVRWQLKRNFPNYDKDSLKTLFLRFGPVTDVRIVSPNSCMVIFENIQSACDVMQCRNLGEHSNKLHCSWWHKSMANKTVVARAKGISFRTNLFLL